MSLIPSVLSLPIEKGGTINFRLIQDWKKKLLLFSISLKRDEIHL